MDIAQQIKTCRRKLNISQDRFGNKVGVSGKTISAYETRRSYPSAKILKALAVEFGIYLVDSPHFDKDLILRKLKDLEANVYDIKASFLEL